MSSGGPYSHLNPTTFMFSAFSATSSSARSVAELALPDLSDNPPQWVDPTWQLQLAVGVLPTPQSKVRTQTSSPDGRKQVASAITKARKGEVTGVSLNWRPPQPADGRSELLGTDVSIHGARVGDEPGLAYEVRATISETEQRRPGCGQSTLRLVVRLVESMDDLVYGVGWFGTLNVPPYCHRVFGWQTRSTVPGYSFVVCLPHGVIDVLGGVEAVRSSPAALIEIVRTSSGQDCAVCVLHDVPALVDDPLLRAWRDFLEPVLPADAAARRRHEFEIRSVPPGSIEYQLPPMMLADDWPVSP